MILGLFFSLPSSIGNHLPFAKSFASSSNETPNDLNEIIDESKKPHLGYDFSVKKNAYTEFYSDKII